MCGIFGYLGPETIQPESILRSLHHRGPDDSGCWQYQIESQQLMLIQTRLAILDLSPGGHQPMIDENNGNVIVFNGEIYNFRELREQLQSRGVVFKSQSDTEVLLKGYRVWGRQLLDRLDGMFTFVLYDCHQQQLMIARDHIGIKPLYYARTQGGGLAFASEVRTLIASGRVSSAWDQQSLRDYLVYGAIQEPRTIYQEICAFPPAHFATLDIQKPQLLQPQCYWNMVEIAYAAQSSPTPLNSRLIHREILDRTLEQQIAADVPVGLFLSGGIDTTALACLLAPQSSNYLHAFTFGLQNHEADEAPLAATTALNLGFKHSIARLEKNELNDWLLAGFAAMDQPSADGLNTYLISRASKAKGMTVVLSGCGADELHGGYSHFRQLSQLWRWQQWGQQGGKFGDRLTQKLIHQALSLVHRHRGPLVEERLNLMMQQWQSPLGLLSEKRRFLTPSQIQVFWPQGDSFPGQMAIAPIPPKLLELEIETQLSIYEIQGYLRNTLLRDSDWATMANQQELRVPFLGKRYLEMVLQLPWSEKRAVSGLNKPLIAQQITAAGEHVLQRRKTGFTLDYGAYLCGALREPMEMAFKQLNQNFGFTLNAAETVRSLQSDQGRNQVSRYWALTSLGLYLGRS